MPTLRELQKRLESAETIKQLSGAMRSAATAKYTKLCAGVDAYSPYDEALREIARQSALNVGSDDPVPDDGGFDGPELCIMVAGNRGLCGGYHQQLFSFFNETIQNRDVRVAVCGKKALDLCRSKKIPVEASFAVSDQPTQAEAKEIAAYARDLFESGEVGRVTVCGQHFYNMLKSEPHISVILQKSADGEPESADDGVIFIPDRPTVVKSIEFPVLVSNVYDLLLSAAAGVQAATLVAMRSAYENADSSITSLEIRINRLRQAAVTASVLETATDEKEQL